MYRRNEQRWMKHIDFIAGDLLAICLAFLIGYHSYFKHFSFWHLGLYSQSFVVLILIDIICLVVGETFKNVLKRTGKEELRSVVIHWGVVMFLHLIWLYVIQRSGQYPRRTFAITAIVYFLLSSLSRILLKRLLINRNARKSILILTTEPSAEADITAINKNNFRGYRIAAVSLLDQKEDHEPILGYNVIRKDSVVDYVVKNWVDEVYISTYQLATRHKTILKNLVEAGITIHIAMKSLPALDGTRQMIEKVGGENTITAAMATMTTLEGLQKRLLDIVGGLVGSFITICLIPVVYVLIQKEDPGPIFYASKRVGQNGKVFKMYKFRSMVMNADELKDSLQKENTVKDGMMFKIDHDPRIIGGKDGIGELLRRTSLDEFPQFFNVLLGQMSLVGTRPPTLDEWEKYKPRHRARLSSKPGITGLWQVSGRSDIKDFEEVVKLDREYITNWSIWTDIKILFKTIAVVFEKDGSY